MDFYGVSYTVYQEKETDELKARTWLDAPDMGYTHMHCMRELMKSGHMPVANGILLYDKTTDCWIPIFETPLYENRSESERRRHIDVACQQTERCLCQNDVVKNHLSALWQEKVLAEEKWCLAKNMPTEAIRIHIQNMRSNRYY
jgi:hypothetical protein